MEATWITGLAVVLYIIIGLIVLYVGYRIIKYFLQNRK